MFVLAHGTKRGFTESLPVSRHHVMPTSLSSADSVRKRPMASLMTSVSSMSGCSSVMLFLFSSSHSWKPVFGLNRRIREAKSLQPGLVSMTAGLKRDCGCVTLPLVLRVVCRRARGRSLCLFLLICRLFLLTGCLCARHLQQGGLSLEGRRTEITICKGFVSFLLSFLSDGSGTPSSSECCSTGGPHSFSLSLG